MPLGPKSKQKIVARPSAQRFFATPWAPGPKIKQKIAARPSAQRFFATPMGPPPFRKNLIDQDLQIISYEFAKDDPLTPPLLPTYGNCLNLE